MVSYGLGMGFVSCGDNPRYKTTHWVVVPILCLQNAIGSGLSAPTNSIDGILAATASPAISYQIGQYFKVLAHKNQITGGKDELTAGQETAHILAHAILGAAVAAAGGNDALAGGLAAAGAEATAPILSQWLYGKNPADLTADEKATISAIAGLTGAATGVTVGGSMADVAQGDQAGHIAVDNNTEFGDKIREYINDTKRYWHTEKEAKDNLDVIRNVAVNLIGDGLDSVVGLADYSIDSLNALVYCTGVTPNLCNQMQATLDPKNKAALDSIKAVFDTRTYIQFYELLDKAAHGDLQAREAAGELLAAVLITKKVNLNVGKVSKAGKGTNATINNGTTGTVWDSVKATQPNYPGSVIPKSFEMTLPNGQKVWIHGNATEHIAEYAQFKAKDYTPEAVRLSSQQQLNSLQGALNSATKNGVEYNKLITIDGWELKLAPPRQLGELPAVIHARPVK
jgi:hypothetical protein